MNSVALNIEPEQSLSDSEQTLVDQFNRLYYDGPNNKPLFTTTTWLGVPTYKCPTDVWVYQEILYRTKPDVILETGVFHGGSTLYLASLCDLLGHGQVVACDISLGKVFPQVISHPRIQLFESSSVDLQFIEKLKTMCEGKRVMVILDSDHTEKHVSEELRLYSQLVTPGCYLICEDTNVNGHPSFPTFGPGPYEAVQKFLSETKGWKVDRECERLLVTFNPSGYLVKQDAAL